MSKPQHWPVPVHGCLKRVKQGALDIGGLMARVGHSGVGGFVLEQLQAFGLKPEQVLRVNKGERYTLAIPKQGVELVLQCLKKTGADGKHPQYWGLAEVKLLTQNAQPYDHWRGPWLGGIDPYATNLLARVQSLWGGDETESGLQRSYFVVWCSLGG